MSFWALIDETNQVRTIQIIKGSANRGFDCTKPRWFVYKVESERKDAFGELYNRYCKDVWNFICSQEKRDEVRKDIWGSVWKTAFEKLPSFEYRGTSIKGWLFSTANIKLQEFWRMEKERNDISLSDVYTQAYKSIDWETDLEQDNPREKVSDEAEIKKDILIAKLSMKLKPKEREIINLRYYRELNSTEIGKLLNMKPGAVRISIKRILEKMRHFSEELSKESK